MAGSSGGGIVENRRRAERQPAIWIGTWQYEGDSTQPWRDCGVFDVSNVGLGADLRLPDAGEIVGRRILVRLPVGASIDVVFSGEVKNAKAGPEDIVRVGIEFAELTEDERSIIGSLGSVILAKPSPR
jgi:hypothetical protein